MGDDETVSSTRPCMVVREKEELLLVSVWELEEEDRSGEVSSKEESNDEADLCISFPRPSPLLLAVCGTARDPPLPGRVSLLCSLA